MAAATDYLSVAQAKTDLRLDEGTFEDDATIERYIGDAVGMVSGIVGYDLLEVETADIKPALQGLVAFAANYRFEGAHDVPAALYALAAPHRVLVDEDDVDEDDNSGASSEGSTDDDTDDTEDDEMPLPYETYEVDLTAGQTVTVDLRSADVPFTWFAAATDEVLVVELSDVAAPENDDDWTPAENDWSTLDVVAPGDSIRRGVTAPVAWMRWRAGAAGTVRLVYRGTIEASVA